MPSTEPIPIAQLSPQPSDERTVGEALSLLQVALGRPLLTRAEQCEYIEKLTGTRCSVSALRSYENRGLGPRAVMIFHVPVVFEKYAREFAEWLVLPHRRATKTNLRREQLGQRTERWQSPTGAVSASGADRNERAA